MVSGLRAARAISAGVVASIAAWSSYWHMVHVALAYGERPEVAWVLPFSVDGMLVVASMAITDDRRSGRRVRPVARVAFLAGVSASVAANVTAAAPEWGARLVAAWPAVALLLVVETLATTGRTVRPVFGQPPVRAAGAEEPPVTTGQPAGTPQVPAEVPRAPGPVPPDGLGAGEEPAGAVAVPGPADAGEPAAGRRRVRRPAEATRRMAEEILAAEPDLSRADLARRVGLSPRRLREVLAPPPP